ncbi:MAG: hypothetical protein ACREDR_00160 [Blastocatellia bacterium]
MATKGKSSEPEADLDFDEGGQYHRVHCDISPTAFKILQRRAKRYGRTARKQGTWDLEQFLLGSPEAAPSEKLHRVS